MTCSFLAQRITKLREFLRMTKDGNFTSFKVEKRYTKSAGIKYEKHAITVFDPKNDATYDALQRMILFYLPAANIVSNHPYKVQVNTNEIMLNTGSSYGMIRVSAANVVKVFKKLQNEYQHADVSAEHIDLILKTYL